MIPDNVNIAELASELDKDLVAMGQVTGDQHPTLEPDMIKIAEEAADSELGSIGFVVLDETPAVTADLRDIAQELLTVSSVDTIAIRAPGSGAIVSDVHSRAALESAQHEMLGTTDYVAGAELLIRDVTDSGLIDINWGQVGIFGIVALVAVLVLASFFVRRGASFTKKMI